MDIQDTEDIVNYYEYWEEMSCSCHIGNPPCGKCVSMPSEEMYNEALNLLGEI
jgi:hypothetical protein